MKHWTHGHAFSDDGDYIVYGYWTETGLYEVNYFLIPGTQLEDE